MDDTADRGRIAAWKLFMPETEGKNVALEGRF